MSNFIGCRPVSLVSVVGGFSDADWPNIASGNGTPINRPVLSGSTLTWVGPLGGGANNGNPVQQTTSLTTSAGFTTSSNGQVISGLNLTSRLTIAHNNVLVKQCALDFVDGAELIAVGGSTTGLIIEDCWINGQKGSFNGINAPVTPFQWSGTVRRCTILGCENNITGNPVNVTISDTYLGQCGNSNTSTFDGDLIEDYHGSSLTVSNTTFDMQNSQTSPGDFNSAFNISNVSTISGTVITGCHFCNTGVSAFIVCDDNGQGGGAVTWSFTNNCFFATNAPGTVAYRRDAVPLISNSGNFVATTWNLNSGSLINGTGQI